MSVQDISEMVSLLNYSFKNAHAYTCASNNGSYTEHLMSCKCYTKYLNEIAKIIHFVFEDNCEYDKLWEGRSSSQLSTRRKFNIDSFAFHKVLGKGSFGKVS